MTDILPGLCIQTDTIDKYGLIKYDIKEGNFQVAKLPDILEALDDEIRKNKLLILSPIQIDEICFRIGEWYLFSKSRMCNYHEQNHNLGSLKEYLKDLLCNDNYNEELEYIWKDKR